MSIITFAILHKDLVLKSINNGIEVEFVISNITQYPKEDWIIMHNMVKNWSLREMYHELRYEYVYLQLNHDEFVIKSHCCKTTISLPKNSTSILNAFQTITNNTIWKQNDIDMVIDI